MSSSERPKPYVGVSGVVSPEQQAQLNDIFTEAGLLQADRILALGVKAVHKTQFLDIENKYGSAWYPVGEEAFTGALAPHVADSHTMGVAQTYFDLEMITNPGYREFFGDRILRRGAPWIDGIQFDMLPWHEDAAMMPFLEKLKQKHDTKLLLQVHGHAMEALGPKGVTKLLGRHAAILDYILFDASHGKGERLDTARLLTFIEEAYSATPLDSVGIALAGGLNGRVVEEELPPVVEKFNDISWDAEGQLHSKSTNNEQPLDMAIVRDYLRVSAGVSGK